MKLQLEDWWQVRPNKVAAKCWAEACGCPGWFNSSNKEALCRILGKHTGKTGNIESNLYQKTAGYLDEWSNGYHIVLDAEELVKVLWDQVESRQ